MNYILKHKFKFAFILGYLLFLGYLAIFVDPNVAQ